MSTKTQISTLIDTNYASGQPVNAAQDRDTLKDDTNSILNNIYADEIIDTELTQTVFTVATPGSVSFNFRFLKQGRRVTLNGTLTAISTVTTVGTITLDEFKAPLGRTYYDTGILLGTETVNLIQVRNLSGSTIFILLNSLFVGQTLNFNITYNTAT